MIGEEVLNADDSDQFSEVLKDPEVLRALQDPMNAEMAALWEDQQAYMAKAARGKHATKGMRWHPR
jgi:hypothetical protein